MLKLGDKNITKLYYSDKAISKAYWGNNLVFNTKASDDGHTEIEYLEGDRVSYINTGVTADSGLTIEMKLYVPAISGTTYVLGAYDGSQRFYPMYFSGGRICNRMGTGTAYQSGDGALKVGWHHFLIKTSKNTDVEDISGTTTGKAKSRVWEYVDGSPVLRISNSMYSGTTSKDLYLFANNGNGSVSVGNTLFNDTTGYLRMAFCKIKNYAGELIRDYIPVEKSDGVKCLYDKVEGKYYEFQTV